MFGQKKWALAGQVTGIQWGDNWRTVDVGRIGGGSVKNIQNSIKTEKGGTFMPFIQNSQLFIGEQLPTSPFSFFLSPFPKPLFYPSPFPFLSLSLSSFPLCSTNFRWLSQFLFYNLSLGLDRWRPPALSDPAVRFCRHLIHALVTPAFECNALYLITPQGASHQRKRKQNKKRNIKECLDFVYRYGHWNKGSISATLIYWVVELNFQSAKHN